MTVNNSGGHRELELETLRADVAFIKGAVVQIMDELTALRRFVHKEREVGDAGGGAAANPSNYKKNKCITATISPTPTLTPVRCPVHRGGSITSSFASFSLRGRM